MKKNISWFLTVLALVAMVNSCKKTPATVPTQAGLGSNLHIIDTTQWIQNTNYPERIAGGTYDFTFTQTTPYINIKPGDIILSPKGEGFLRKVLVVTVNNAALTLQTSQAGLGDVFKAGNFSFDMDLSGMNHSATGFADTFSHVVFYNSSGINEQLLEGNFSMNPTWHFNMAFDTNGLTNFGLMATNANYNNHFTLYLNSAHHLSFQNKVEKLGDFTKQSVQWITVGAVKVPVVVTMEVDMTATATGFAVSLGKSQTSFSSSGQFTMGVQYSGGAWQNNYTLSPNSTLAVNPVSNPATYWANVSIVPKISIRLYGVECAYASLGMENAFNSKLSTPGNWNYYSDAWFYASTGAPQGIYGAHVPASSQSWSSDTVNYQTPAVASKDSGDAQVAPVTTVLPQKLKVKVLDSYGNPQAGVPVSFTPALSCGTISPAKPVTDATGYATVTWTLGTVHGSQSVTAVVKNGLDAPLVSLQFTATGQ